jgi:hypothetical protein
VVLLCIIYSIKGKICVGVKKKKGSIINKEKKTFTFVLYYVHSSAVIEHTNKKTHNMYILLINELRSK